MIQRKPGGEPAKTPDHYRCVWSQPAEGRCEARWTRVQEWPNGVQQKLCNRHFDLREEIRPASPMEVSKALERVQTAIGQVTAPPLPKRQWFGPKLGEMVPPSVVAELEAIRGRLPVGLTPSDPNGSGSSTSSESEKSDPQK